MDIIHQLDKNKKDSRNPQPNQIGFKVGKTTQVKIKKQSGLGQETLTTIKKDNLKSEKSKNNRLQVMDTSDIVATQYQYSPTSTLRDNRVAPSSSLHPDRLLVKNNPQLQVEGLNNYNGTSPFQPGGISHQKSPSNKKSKIPI